MVGAMGRLRRTMGGTTTCQQHRDSLAMPVLLRYYGIPCLARPYVQSIVPRTRYQILWYAAFCESECWCYVWVYQKAQASLCRRNRCFFGCDSEITTIRHAHVWVQLHSCPQDWAGWVSKLDESFNAGDMEGFVYLQDRQIQRKMVKGMFVDICSLDYNII